MNRMASEEGGFWDVSGGGAVAFGRADGDFSEPEPSRSTFSGPFQVQFPATGFMGMEFAPGWGMDGVFEALKKQAKNAVFSGGKWGAYSHFYSHSGYSHLKITTKTSFLLGFLGIGAGEGNRTLITG
jgi:hypothetical protein